MSNFSLTFFDVLSALQVCPACERLSSGTTLPINSKFVTAAFLPKKKHVT